MTGSGKVIDSSTTGSAGSQSVSPVKVALQTDDRRDIAGAHRGNLLPVVRVHLQQPADPLALALGGVQRVAAGFQRAGVDADEGQLADVRVGRDLEDQGRERLARLDPADDLFARLRIVPVTGGTSSGDGR